MTKCLCNLATIGESIGRLGFQHKTSLDQIAADFQHPEWPVIDEVINSGRFSVVADFLQHQQIVVSAVFRVAETTKFMSELVNHDFFIELVPIAVWIKAINACDQMFTSLFGVAEGHAFAKDYVSEKIECILKAAPCLTTILAWVKYQLWGDLSEPVLAIALAIQQEPLALINDLWCGQESLCQRTLLRRFHAETTWPAPKLFIKALKAFYQEDSKSTLHTVNVLQDNKGQSLFWPLHQDFKCDVLNLPVLCGLWAASGVSTTWWLRSLTRQYHLKSIVRFDEFWFQVAYNQGCKIALALDAHHEFNRE